MATFLSIPQHLQQRLQNELKPGESVVWVGQPNANRVAKSAFKLWFFFLPLTAFALFWMVGASGFNTPDVERDDIFLALFGLPFVLAGFGGLSAPLWLKRKAASTIYAITNRRALSIEGAKSITVKSYMGAEIANIEKIQHQDGSGDLILRTELYRDADGDRQTRKEGFFAVEDVRSVERLLDSLIRLSATKVPR